VLPPERVRTQLSEQHGGADAGFNTSGKHTGGARMLAVVTLHPGIQGRNYRLPTERDYQAVWKAQKRLTAILDEWRGSGGKGLCPVPDEAISLNEIRRISVPLYGMTSWGDLFTARQNVALVELIRLVRKRNVDDDAAINEVLAAAFSRCVDHWSSGAMWIQDLEAVAHTFGRQALPIVWDFVEAYGFGNGGAVWEGQLDWVARTIEAFPGSRVGQVQTADATKHPLPDQVAGVLFTDPPYYDAVPYSHLADYFFVWLKRMLHGHPLFGGSSIQPGSTTPKEREIVVDRPHHLSTSTKDAEFYEVGMAESFAEGRRVLREDGIGSVVSAAAGRLPPLGRWLPRGGHG
jgi:adenine-specific DNA methylase